jgi:streptomycin 3"-adenylyltransferase
MDPASEQYCENVAQIISSSFEDQSNLLGVYLHGSAVLGGFDFRSSDIDILAVCRQPMTIAEKDAVAERLSRTRLPCSAAGLEMSIVTFETAQSPARSPPYELHMTTIPGDTKTIDGEGQLGDPDLILHFAVCRQSGRPLREGYPPGREIFPPISKDRIIAQIKKEVYSGLGQRSAAEEYAVLNACRAWRYHYDGALVSKVDGGEWALSKQTLSDSERQLIERALQWHRSTVEATLDLDVGKQFIRRVLDLLGQPTSWSVLEW